MKGRGIPANKVLERSVLLFKLGTGRKLEDSKENLGLTVINANSGQCGSKSTKGENGCAFTAAHILSVPGDSLKQ